MIIKSHWLYMMTSANNGLNAFLPMDASFLLWSFLKQRNCQHNGFRQVFMANGHLIITKKDGRAMNMVWIGSKDALNLTRATKLWGNIVFSFVTGMIATSL